MMITVFVVLKKLHSLLEDLVCMKAQFFVSFNEGTSFTTHVIQAFLFFSLSLFSSFYLFVELSKHQISEIFEANFFHVMFH